MWVAACRFDPDGVGGSGALGSSGSGPTSDAAATAGDGTSNGPGTSEGSGGVEGTSAGSGGAGSGSSGAADPCAIDHGGCDPIAICTAVDGEATCVCPDGLGGDGTVCEPLPVLAPLRAELPCDVQILGGCTTDDVAVSTTMVGPEGGHFLATVRVRGAIERLSYIGGAPDDSWNPGGEVPLADIATVATLRVSDPKQMIRLNHGSEGVVVAIDEIHAFAVAVGATVELSLEAGGLGILGNNADVVVPGVPPDPLPFDGQFIDLQFTAFTPV